jgi:transposase
MVGSGESHIQCCVKVTMPKPSMKPYTLSDLESLPPLNLNAAGLDIGASEIYACVPSTRAEQPVRSFATFTGELHALAQWLQDCQIDTVVMESTGVYWVPIYEILEARGLEVLLVRPRDLKNVAARKSDVSDCQWLQRLHTYGLLRGSFRPPEEIAALRSLVRHRDTLTQDRSRQILHMQKALQLMNIQLSQVISDITGVTGLKIIRAIVAGERSPQRLAQYRDAACKRSQATLEQALTGHYRSEHVFVLKQALELYDFYDCQIQQCDQEIEQRYEQATPSAPDGHPPTTLAPHSTRRKPRKNQAHFDLSGGLYRLVGVDLTRIDGFDALTAQKVITEIGIDMSKWPTVKHFASWLRLAPNARQSGGKVLSSRVPPSSNRANLAFRLAAQSLARSHSALGAFYRRMRANHGSPKAIVATAHRLARTVYFMLKYREDYHDPGPDDYERRYRDRFLRRLQRNAAELGYRLEPVLAGQVS